MRTDERIHMCCNNIGTINSNDGIYLQESQQIMDNSNSSQLIIGDNYVNTHLYMQNRLNNEIKDSSIKLTTSYWTHVFESIKLINRSWSKIFNIGNI